MPKKFLELISLPKSLNSKISLLKEELKQADLEFRSIIHQNYEESVSSNTRPIVPPTEPPTKGLGWGDGLNKRLKT